MKPTWNRVSHSTLPPLGHVVLAYSRGQYSLLILGRNGADDLRWYPGGHHVTEFDFWMPLPEEPARHGRYHSPAMEGCHEEEDRTSGTT